MSQFSTAFNLRLRISGIEDHLDYLCRKTPTEQGDDEIMMLNEELRAAQEELRVLMENTKEENK
jgi:hypothetical protein